MSSKRAIVPGSEPDPGNRAPGRSAPPREAPAAPADPAGKAESGASNGRRLEGSRGSRRARALCGAVLAAAAIAWASCGKGTAAGPDGGGPPAGTLDFSGRNWTVRGAGTGGPGPNLWSPVNAWTDAQGRLHLAIRRADSGWTCAEVFTREGLGFGDFSWTLAGREGRLDRNVALGLFTYPAPGTGPDGTNEIDIEISRWGVPNAPAGNFTVWPATQGRPHRTFSFPFEWTAASSVHAFAWRPGEIRFRTLQPPDTLASWRFASVPSGTDVPSLPCPVHMNLWLVQGRPPSDGREVEVVVESFSHAP